jgi:hypothetical protein
MDFVQQHNQKIQRNDRKGITAHVWHVGDSFKKEKRSKIVCSLSSISLSPPIKLRFAYGFMIDEYDVSIQVRRV